MTVSSPDEDAARRCRYRAYGVELASELPLPCAASRRASPGSAWSLRARARPRGAVESLWSGGGELVHDARLGAGARLTVERGRAGDHLIRYDEHPFHLSPERTVLSSAPAPGIGWQHAFLDWVPYSIAALAGTTCLHAGAVLTEAGVLAIAAPAGAGKSTLVAELLRTGATFFCDDVLALHREEDGVLAHPGAPFACLDLRRRELAELLGRPWGLLREELWVAVGRPATAPAGIAAVVLLDRRAGGPAAPLLEPAGLPALRGLAIGFGGAERERFEILAAVAERTPLLRLRADPAVPPEELAEAALAGLYAGSAR